MPLGSAVAMGGLIRLGAWHSHADLYDNRRRNILGYVVALGWNGAGCPRSMAVFMAGPRECPGAWRADGGLARYRHSKIARAFGVIRKAPH